MAFQQTLKIPVSLSGVGLHTGQTVHLRLLPAASDCGVRFRRSDLTPAVEIPARSEHVVETTLATVLGKDGAQVSTVEHCLAALYALGVDNCTVEVDGPELPILDGSAGPYAAAILGAGLRRQRGTRQVLRVEKPIRVENGDKFCILRPAEKFRVTYSIDFDGRFPGAQHYYLDVGPRTFATELAAARTFGFLAEVTYLRSVGKARGGSLENAVVVDGDRVLNPEGLRMPDEMVRHKILDAVGDLALAGRPVCGHLIVHKGGHALHDALVKALLANPDAWSLVDMDAAPRRRERATVVPSPLVPAHA
ncbi:MAG: UDP-3-O-acyl-N-acetylglucosamine deacetylase [Deferrisomatales bacterium]|nr:UDP-3-O-acyl-N-acetylglucosamine deacetylase [Deferrisomatales bacterium]